MERPVTSPWHRTPTVLVVDGDPCRREEAVEALAELGCRILDAGWAEDALRLAHEVHIDVIIADHDLDDQSGLDLLLTVSANSSRPRRVLLVGAEHAHLGAVAAETGEVWRCLRKPIAKEKLQLAIYLTLASLEPEPR